MATIKYGTISITDTADTDLRVAGFKYYLPVTNNHTASAELKCPHFETLRKAKRYIDESTFTATATYASGSTA